MEELTPEQIEAFKEDQKKAYHANNAMDNPLIQEWFETIEHNIVESWKASENEKDRENLHLRYRLAQQFQRDFEVFIENGIFATEQLSTWEKMKGFFT